ncbi:MAG: hypothetical protein DHS80DRAFT_28584 [Piptocephalis tieghemiana]|nr:MAG: hypothetical protein DHS80DRAFT_28584 [Piptocephalis tieghemiana]
MTAALNLRHILDGLRNNVVIPIRLQRQQNQSTDEEHPAKLVMMGMVCPMMGKQTAWYPKVYNLTEAHILLSLFTLSNILLSRMDRRETFAGILPGTPTQGQGSRASSRRNSFAPSRSILKEPTRTLDFDSLNTLTSIPSQEDRAKSRRVSFANMTTVRIFNTESRLERREPRTASIDTDFNRSPKASDDAPPRRASVGGDRFNFAGSPSIFSSETSRAATSSSSSSSSTAGTTDKEGTMKDRAVSSFLSSLRSSSYPEAQSQGSSGTDKENSPSEPTADSDSSFYVSDVDVEESLAGDPGEGSHEDHLNGDEHDPPSNRTRKIGGLAHRAPSSSSSLIPFKSTVTSTEEEEEHARLLFDVMDDEQSDEEEEFHADLGLHPNEGADTFAERHVMKSLSPLQLPSDVSLDLTDFHDGEEGVKVAKSRQGGTDQDNTTANLQRLFNGRGQHDEAESITQELREMDTLDVINQSSHYQSKSENSRASYRVNAAKSHAESSPFQDDDNSDSDWMEETLPIGRIRTGDTGRLSLARRDWMDTTGSVDGDEGEEMEETQVIGGLQSFRLPSSLDLGSSEGNEDHMNPSRPPVIKPLSKDDLDEDDQLSSPKLLSPSQLLPSNSAQREKITRRHTLFGSSPKVALPSSLASARSSLGHHPSGSSIPYAGNTMRAGLLTSSESNPTVQEESQMTTTGQDPISMIPGKGEGQQEGEASDSVPGSRKRRSFPLYAYAVSKSPRGRMSGSPGRAMHDSSISPTPDPPYSISITSSPGTPSVSQEMVVATSKYHPAPRSSLYTRQKEEDKDMKRVDAPTIPPGQSGSSNLLRTPPRRRVMEDERTRTPLHMQSAARIAVSLQRKGSLLAREKELEEELSTLEHSLLHTSMGPDHRQPGTPNKLARSTSLMSTDSLLRTPPRKGGLGRPSTPTRLSATDTPRKPTNQQHNYDSSMYSSRKKDQAHHDEPLPVQEELQGKDEDEVDVFGVNLTLVDSNQSFSSNESPPKSKEATGKLQDGDHHPVDGPTGNEDARLHNQHPYTFGTSGMTCKEFLERTGIHFMENMEASRRPFIAPPSPSDGEMPSDLELLRAMTVDSPMLEFVMFVCSNLKTLTEKTQKEAASLVASIDSESPLLVQEYCEGGMEERLEIQEYQHTKQYNSILDQALPSIRSTHQKLREKLRRIKLRKQEIVAADQEQLSSLNEAIDEQSSQLKIFQQELEGHQQENSRLVAELHGSEAQKQSVMARIEAAKATCQGSQARSLMDLEEIRERYQLHEAMTPWELRRLTDDAGQVDLVMNADQRVRIQLRHSKARQEEGAAPGKPEWSIQWGGFLEHRTLVEERESGDGASQVDDIEDEEEGAGKSTVSSTTNSSPALSLSMSPGYGLAKSLSGIRRALLMVLRDWRGRSLLMDDLVRLSSLYRVRIQKPKGDGGGVRVGVTVVDSRHTSIYTILFHLPSSHLNHYPGHPLQWSIHSRKGYQLRPNFEEKAAQAMTFPGDKEGHLVYGRIVKMVKALQEMEE